MGKPFHWLLVVLLCIGSGLLTAAQAQEEDDDIFKEVDLRGLEYKKARSYCQRLYAYYRYVDDGVAIVKGREQKLYRIYEGICELDIRYKKDYDDGAEIMVARNLVHQERESDFMDYYELKPYTFLEKARRDPKHFTVETGGDTTRVYTKLGLAGTAVRDTARHELRIDYNALSPDTSMTINFLIIKGHLDHVNAQAVYHIEDDDIDYVPQGQLKHIVFEGDAYVDVMGIRENFHERTELYVDSVAYMTRDEYRADKKFTVEQRRQRSGYKAQADIDRLKQKLGVPPLTAEQLRRMEEQRDWEDELEHMEEADRMMRAMKKGGEKLIESDAYQNMYKKLEPKENKE